VVLHRAAVVAVIVTAAFWSRPSTNAFAGDAISLYPPDWTRDDGLRTEPRTLEPPPSSGAPAIDHRSIVLDLKRLTFAGHGADGGFVHEVAPPSSNHAVYDFSGIPCVLYHFVMGYYKQAFQDELYQHWATGYMTIMDLEHAHERYVNGLAEARYGRWWDRTWRESLPVEKGGIPLKPQVIEIGREIEVFRLWDFALTTEGRVVAPGNVALYLSDDRVYQSVPTARTIERDTATANVRRDSLEARNDPKAPSLIDRDPPGSHLRAGDDSYFARFVEDDVRIDLLRVLHGVTRERYARTFDASLRAPTPAGNMYTGDGWNLVGRLTVIAKASMSMPLSYASGQLELNLFPGLSREHWATLHLRMKVQSKTQAGSPPFPFVAQLDFEVLGW
jgi:hypothetical protein